MKNERCPSCGSASFRELYDVTRPTAHEAVGLPGLIRECTSCGMIFKSFDKNLDELYNDAYAAGFQDLGDYSGEAARQLFSGILEESKQRMPGIPHPDLLDIGSGSGTLLDTAAAIGFRTTGVELSSKLAAVAESKGHKVINRNISDMTETHAFDVISMMDIIEHLEQPVEILQSLKKLLKPQGELVVYTPNHASMIVKLAHVMYKLGMRNAVDNIFACTHTCFFTTASLRKILEDTGYEIIRVRHFRYDTSRPGQKVSTAAKLAVNAIEIFGNITGAKGFRVVMYARKKS